MASIYSLSINRISFEHHCIIITQQVDSDQLENRKQHCAVCRFRRGDF
jgi:hypothetical protein